MAVDPFPDLDGAPSGLEYCYTFVLRSALAQPRQARETCRRRSQRPLLVQRDVGTHDRGEPGRTIALVQRFPQRMPPCDNAGEVAETDQNAVAA